MKTLATVVAAAVAATLIAGAAHAVTITVTPSLAPNAFGPASFGPWTSNAVNALYNGQSSAGTPGTPTFYLAQSNVEAKDLVVTNFPSWMGQADPATAFGAAYGAEGGNRGHFGLVILGEGQQFSISELSFTGTSTDPGHLLNFALDGYDYSTSYVGVLAGGDGTVGTGDDVFVTSGPSTQLVDALFGRGSGNAIEGLCTGCTVAQQQAAIDAAAASFGGAPFQFTGEYQLRAVTGALVAEGSGSFNVAGVPEPSAWALMLIGFGGLGAALRRRRAVPTAVA
jgi:hypothetical protein